MSSKTIVSLMLALVLTVGLSTAAQAVQVQYVDRVSPGASDTLKIGDKVKVLVGLSSSLADVEAARTMLQVWVAGSENSLTAVPDTVIARSSTSEDSLTGPRNLATNWSGYGTPAVTIERSAGTRFTYEFTLPAMTTNYPDEDARDHTLIRVFACGRTTGAHTTIDGAVKATSALFSFDPQRPTETDDVNEVYPVESVGYRIVSYSAVPDVGDTLLKLGDKIEVSAVITYEAGKRKVGTPWYLGDVVETVIAVGDDPALTKRAEVATAAVDASATTVTVDSGWDQFETKTKAFVFGFVRDKAGNLSSTTMHSQTPHGFTQLDTTVAYFYVDGKAPTLKDTTAYWASDGPGGYPLKYRAGFSDSKSTLGAFDGSKASDGTQPVAGYPGVSVSDADNRLKIHISEPGNIKVTVGSASSVWTDTLDAAAHAAANGIIAIDPFSETSGDSLVDGTYSVTVEGSDEVGNPAASLSMTYKYDGTFPKFNELYPVSGDTVGTSHVYVTLSEALDSLWIQWKSVAGGATDDSVFQASVRSNLDEQTLAVTSNDSLQAGTYDLVLYGRDKVGNVTKQTVSGIEVATDYVVPTITEFNLTDTAPSPLDSVDVGSEITVTVKAWDATVSKVAPRYKEAGVTVSASPAAGGVTYKVEKGLTDNGDGTATLDASHWVNGVGKGIKVKSSVVYEGAPLIVTVTDASGHTGVDTLYYFPMPFSKYIVTARDTVVVGEAFDVIVTPTDKYGHPSLKSAAGVYTAPFSEVWLAFTANKTDVSLPEPQLIKPLDTAVAQKTTSIGADTFQVTATAATANLIVTVRTTDVAGTTVQAWGSTSPITVLEEALVTIGPPAGLKIMGGSTDVINPDNVAAVIVSGYAAGADSIQAKLLDKDGVEAASEWVTALAGNGYFSTTINASALADGRVQYTAMAALNGAMTEWATTTEGIFPDVIKDTAALDAPDTLMAQDYPNDNGEWVLLTFDPSDSKVDRYRIYREITIVPAEPIIEATDSIVTVTYDTLYGTDALGNQYVTGIDSTVSVEYVNPDTTGWTDPEKEYISWAVVSAYDPTLVGATYIRALVATLGDAAAANYKVAAEAGGETSSSPNAVLARKVSDAPVVATPAMGKMLASSSVWSSPLTNAAAAAAVDNIPPAAITALLAFDTPNDAGGTITVGWGLSPDDRILSSYTWNWQTRYIRGVTAYNVYRKAADEEFVKVGSIGHGVNTYRDRTAVNNTDYVYEVRVADLSNEVASGLEAVWAFAAINEGVPTGDWTSDGSVGLDDFSRFASAYGNAAPAGSSDAIFDLDGNGVVDLGDFSIFASHYGETTGGVAKAVPVVFGKNTDVSLTMSAAEEAGLYTVQVSLDKVAGAKSYGFVMNYDVHAFAFERAVVKSASTVPFLVQSTKPGEVHIAHAIKGEAIAEISFKVKDDFGGTVRVSEARVWDRYHRTNTVDLGAAALKMLPKVFALKQNYPNPFNPTTVIRYALPEASNVRLEVFNTLGQVVRTLADEEQVAGAYRITWDGRNEQGQEMATGVYIYRIVAGKDHATKRMLLIK